MKQELTMEETIIDGRKLQYTHGYCIHVPNFLKEVFNHAVREVDKPALRIPISVFAKYLDSVARRCSEINDPILNKLMAEMSLYAVADPENKAYDEATLFRILEEGNAYQQEAKNIDAFVENLMEGIAKEKEELHSGGGFFHKLYLLEDGRIFIHHMEYHDFEVTHDKWLSIQEYLDADDGFGFEHDKPDYSSRTFTAEVVSAGMLKEKILQLIDHTKNT